MEPPRPERTALGQWTRFQPRSFRHWLCYLGQVTTSEPRFLPKPGYNSCCEGLRGLKRAKNRKELAGTVHTRCPTGAPRMAATDSSDVPNTSLWGLSRISPVGQRPHSTHLTDEETAALGGEVSYPGRPSPFTDRVSSRAQSRKQVPVPSDEFSASPTSSSHPKPFLFLP